MQQNLTDIKILYKTKEIYNGYSIFTCMKTTLSPGAELHVRVAPPKFFKISFYYIEIFNISIISPQKWDFPHPHQLFELVQ